MSSNNNTESTLVTALCKSWNNLDVSYIENYLSDDFEYSSQMGLANINGKDTYVNYLKGKFIAIKEGNDTVKAELGYYNNIPCLILVQVLVIPELAQYSKRSLMSDGAIEKTLVFLLKE